MIVIVLVIVLAVFTFVVDGILNQISSALF
jgi:preprotein translocase subunit SecE